MRLPETLVVLDLDGISLDGRVLNFLDRLKGLPLMLYTNNGEDAAIAALKAAGIEPGIFQRILAQQQESSVEQSSQSITAAMSGTDLQRIRRVFLIGAHQQDMMLARQIEKALCNTSAWQSAEVIAIGMRKDRQSNIELEAAGADFLSADLDEAANLILLKPIADSLSLVLFAYNEEQTIVQAIADARRFCALYAPHYEIIAVDDGSDDRTSAEIEKASASDVRIVRHAVNRGMGAALQSGYRAATKSYIASLPGDRQVRAQSLAAFLEHIAPKQIVLSYYQEQPSGMIREVMSIIFRILLRRVGGFSVDFAGTYVFSRALFEQHEPPDRVASPTFLYSFQLLEEFKKAGCSFKKVIAHPFPREVGESRIATFPQIAKLTFELLRHRAVSILPQRFH